MLVDLQETEQPTRLAFSSAASLDRQHFGSFGRAATVPVLSKGKESLAVSSDPARLAMLWLWLDVGRKLEKAVGAGIAQYPVGRKSLSGDHRYSVFGYQDTGMWVS